MDYQTVTLKEFRIIGIEKRTSEMSSSYKDREFLLEEFKKTRIWQEIPVYDKEIIYLHTDYDNSRTSHSIIIGFKVVGEDAISKEIIPDNLVVKTISESKYAVFHIQNENIIKGILETWNWINGSDLQRTYICDFEFYAPPHEKEAAIYISIK